MAEAQITLGEIIAKRRKQRNLTQQQLADKLGVTDKAVSKWERNVSFPDTQTLRNLSTVLDLSLAEMLRLKSGDTTIASSTGLKFSIFELILEVICLDFSICAILLKSMDVVSDSVCIIMLGVCVLGITIILIKRGIRPID